MKNLFRKSLLLFVAGALLFSVSCKKKITTPTVETPKNELLGFWHGGANYFGEDLNLEFKESSLAITNYANTNTLDYKCVYGTKEITITKNGTSDTEKITYIESGTSITFTDSDKDSFTVEKGKGK